MNKPVVAVTFGDASGIGPELAAKLLNRPEAPAAARIVLAGDAWVWDEGQRIAGTKIAVTPIGDWQDARDHRDDTPLFLEMETVAQSDIAPAQVTAAAGRGARLALTAALDAASRGEVDAVCFAPLNKLAMKKGGMDFEDELHFFASHLGVTDYFCEFNTLGTLWTSRISSHVPLAEIPKYVTKERIQAAARLTYKTLKRAGFSQPRVAVAALNPHGGEGGTCGREEIDIIEPAVRELNAEGLPSSSKPAAECWTASSPCITTRARSRSSCWVSSAASPCRGACPYPSPPRPMAPPSTLQARAGRMPKR
jgi:4-hydroxythreonine-4-phosphate dehydrogenase